jgi:hypothetical protein
MRHPLLVLLIVLGAPPGHADDAAERGLVLMQEAHSRDAGWGDARAELEMILKNSQGEQSRRELRIDSFEIEHDGDLSLAVFDAPRDIKGTAFLSHTHVLTADDQWLFLPALKRVKRIASANKSGPFVGSEFAYEDLSSREVEKYTYRWLRDEPHDGRPCSVIEARPTYPHSGYTRQVVWLDQDIHRPLRIDFYDRKDSLLKTLTAADHNQYRERHWRPARMHMLNHQTGKSTELLWRNYQFKLGLTKRDFDQNRLKRMR